MAEALDSANEAVFEPTEAGVADVAEFDTLEVSPDQFNGVQLWRIGGEAFQMDAAGRALGKEGPHQFAPMRREAVPDDQQFARDLAEQPLEEADDARPIERVALDLEKQLAVGGERGCDREMVPGQLAPQHGRLTTWGPGPDQARTQVKARFV